MRIVSGYLTGIVLALTLVPCTAWAQSQFTLTIAGNPVVGRGLADSFNNFYLMDTNHPFTSDGLLTNWEIFAQNTNPVALLVYRQKGGAFVEVGRSDVMTPAVGYNMFSMGKKIIHVHAGDFVGAYQPGPTGTIAFSVDGALTGLEACVFRNAELDLQKAALVTLGNASDSTAFAGSCDRHYSLRAIGWLQAYKYPMTAQ